MKFAPGEISKELGEKRSKKRIEELPLELEVVGSQERLVELFDSLETILPLFQVDSVEMVGSQKAQGRVNIKLKLVAFYSPPLANYQQKTVALEDLVLTEEENKLLERLSQFRTAVIGTSGQRHQGETRRTTTGERENPFTFR